MSGKGARGKSKRPLETTLGQAPKRMDDSHLRKPITTSVFGLKQVLALFNTATSEIQDYITYECDVLYECRVCRTIFRSLANFILHKRSYCTQKYTQLDGPNPKNSREFVVDACSKDSGEESRSVSPQGSVAEDPATVVREATVKDSDWENVLTELNGKTSSKGIKPVIDKLRWRQELDKKSREIMNEDLSNPDDKMDDVVFLSEDTNVMLERIETSEAAVFQTLLNEPGENSNSELMKTEVMEIHNIFDQNEAVLGVDGKVCNFAAKPNPYAEKRDFVCVECQIRFSTSKTLHRHVKHKHNQTCLVYPCPDCNEFFGNAWGVYRHLINVHHRNTAQVRRMRAGINANRITHDEALKRDKKAAVTEPSKGSEQDQWMENLEGDKDLQMCGGCGKRFERKAALQSHSQMCIKRMAVKEQNSQKAKVKSKVEKVEEEVTKGAAKRKPKRAMKRQATPSPTVDSNEDSSSIAPPLCVVDSVFTPIEEASIVLDSDEEKENSESAIIPSHLSEVSIVKCAAPVQEVYTISDDSCDSISAAPPLVTVGKSPSAAADALSDEADQYLKSRAAPYMDSERLLCLPCSETFQSEYQLLWHMSLHFSWFRFQCSKCAFMSFSRYECTTHAYMDHGTPNNLMGSTVMPIPTWKVESMAHAFRALANNNRAEGPHMPFLEPMGGGAVPELAAEGRLEIPAEEPLVAASSRPVRNRTKSVKTVQTDFIYDLANVLKMNDNSIKSKNVKSKTANKH